MWKLTALAPLIALTFASAPVCAQESGDLRVAPALAERFAEERLRQRDERRDAGWALVSYGLASVVAGGVAAGVGHEDPFWLAAGLGTAGWGAINALLALGLMDLGDEVRAQVAVQRLMRGVSLDRARQEEERAQYTSASVFAFNAGLDVFYVASGILMAFLATELETPERGLEGYGWAMAAQGAGLLVFDVYEWIAGTARGDRLHEMGAP